MTIQILSPLVVSKIAAGEVVERPASVVKELVENSLDAGANQISVEVSGGGIQLIRVIDNGNGIPVDELEIAFERHATSKITSESDIEGISSLGFRGEALPTIASVADVSMLTRYKNEVAGTSIAIENGTAKSKNKQGCPQGTTVTVRNLFESVPARLKFLKSIATENGQISQLVTQYSMAFPGVKFSLLMNGRITLRTPGNGDLRDALVEVYGLETAQSMLEVIATESGISGFISPPSVSRSNRNYLSFFVNRRWIQNRMISYATEEAYQGMLMTGKHPIVILNISLPSGDIDVNVHPTKREIKFRKESDIFLAVQRAVRETLIGYSTIPGMKTVTHLPISPTPTSIPLPITDGIKTAYRDNPLISEQSRPELTKELPILRVIGQLRNTYILAEGPDGIYLVDQHAAHERVLFERIQEQQAKKDIEIQGLLEPTTVDVTVQQEELLKSQMEILSEAGFSMERFGERTYLLRAVPAILKQRNIIKVLSEILDSLGDLQKSEWKNKIAISLACHGAIRAGQIMSVQEMDELIVQLEATILPRNCPHGRPTMIVLGDSQLESEFGRRG